MAKRSTRKVGKLPPHMSTLHGLHNWFKHLFESLGWMVLAKEKGQDYKVDTYKKSIQHFLRTCEHVMSEYEDHDRKHDLNVLHIYVDCLKGFVEKHL